MIQEKFVLFLYGVIMKKLGWVMKQMTLLKRLLNSFLTNYHKEVAILRNGSNFVFESVDLLFYSSYKISLKRGKSYIKSPEWVLNKKATINPKNKDDKCFQYSIAKILKTIQKEYQILNPLLISIIGMVLTFQQE